MDHKQIQATGACRTRRKGGFFSSPMALATIVFGLLILGLYAALGFGSGAPMFEWIGSAVPAQLEAALAAIGC